MTAGVVAPALRFGVRLVRGAGRRGSRVAGAALMRVPTRLLGTIVRVTTSQRIAALTFDDGPDPRSTPRLLDILEQYGARGTFFVVGDMASRRPDLLARMVQGGHAIGNHSWDHPSFPAITAAERRRQLRTCEDLIRPHGHRLFRPPFMNQDPASMLDAFRLGYRVIGYDVTGHDWRGDPVDLVAERLTRGLAPGSILLLHDGLYLTEDLRFVDREATLGAVRALLQRFAGEYRFVTVPQLLREGRPSRKWLHRPGDPRLLASLRRTYA